MVLALLANGCAHQQRQAGSESAVVKVGVQGGPINIYDGAKLAAVNGDPVMLRYDSPGNVAQLMFRRLNGKNDTLLSGESPRESALNFSVLGVDGQNVYTLWRPKLAVEVPNIGKPGDKFIYFRSSHDGGATFGSFKRLNDANGAFMPVLAYANEKDVYVTWVDERTTSNFDVFFNVSHDGGETWKAKDVKLDGGPAGGVPSIDPYLVAEKEKVWLGWVDSEKNTAVMYVRTSTDRGETWGKQVAVAKSPVGFIKPTLVRSNGRLFYYWYTVNGLEGVWSADDGASWKAIPLVKNTNNMLDMAVTTDASGTIHIALGRKPDERQQENMFYVRSEDGVNFSEPTRISSGPMFQATANLPEIAVNSQGAVMVTWQDHRFFRAHTYVNMSRDGGKTWLPTDAALSDKYGKTVSLYPRIAAAGKEFVVAWTEYADTKQRSGWTSYARLDPEKVTADPDAMVPNAARLKERVNGFWAARIKSDWAKSYDFMDPFFRDRVTRAGYVRTQGIFTYHASEFVSADIQGQRAKVKVHYKYELPATTSPSGKEIVVPPTEGDTEQEWIWMDGDWYLVYKDIMGGDFVVY